MIGSGRCDDRGFVHTGELPIPIRLNGAYAFLERRMGRHEAVHERYGALSEEHVAHLLGTRCAHGGAVAQAAYFLQRLGDTVWIARELDRRRICQVLALAANACFDEVAEERAAETNDDEAQSHQ